MGWTAYYQLLRDRALTDDEIVKLDDYITKSNRPPWECESFNLDVTKDRRSDRVLAEGWQKLPMDLDDSEDHERLCQTLMGLRDVIADVEIRVSDDFDSFGVEGDEICLNAQPGPAPVNVPRAERETFTSPSKLAGVRHAPVALDVATTSPEQIENALVELARMANDHPQRAALEAKLAATDRTALARAGFGECYREVSRAYEVWRLVSTALESLDDVTPIVPGFLDVWSNPHGIYWYGDMSLPVKTAALLARVPDVETRLRDDIDESVEGSDSEIVHRRAEHAAKLLGRGATKSAVAALVRAARTLRERGEMSTGQRYHTYAGVLEGLALAAVDEAVPTLLLAFEGPLYRHHIQALPALAKLAPSRVSPILRTLAATGESLYEVVQALGIAKDIETLRSLCAYPMQHDRDRAIATLRELGVEPPPATELPAPETLVTHPAPAIRSQALREIERRMDPAVMTSVVAIHVLESAIGRRHGGAVGSYGSYFELLPEDLRYAKHDDQLAALRAGRVTTLPEQIIWPAVQPILDGNVDELAAQFPRSEVRIDDNLRTTLRDEEAKILATLS